MGKYISITGGLVVILLGLIGLISWFPFFISALKATVPIVLILGGLIALVAGMSELKGASKAKQEAAPAEEKK